MTDNGRKSIGDHHHWDLSGNKTERLNISRNLFLKFTEIYRANMIAQNLVSSCLIFTQIIRILVLYGSQILVTLNR